MVSHYMYIKRKKYLCYVLLTHHMQCKNDKNRPTNNRWVVYARHLITLNLVHGNRIRTGFKIIRLTIHCFQTSFPVDTMHYRIPNHTIHTIHNIYIYIYIALHCIHLYQHHKPDLSGESHAIPMMPRNVLILQVSTGLASSVCHNSHRK